MSYFDLYFSSKLGKMYSFDPPLQRFKSTGGEENLTEHPTPWQNSDSNFTQIDS